METIAVYWESKIRTYGFSLLEGQILCQVHVPADGIAVWSRLLQQPNNEVAQFRLVWSHAGTHGQIMFCLLCDKTHWGSVVSVLNGRPEKEGGELPFVQRPVDIIYFQGPHFGDRYGIVDFTYKALGKAQTPLLGMVCSVASIYLVLPFGWGAKTKQLLIESFEIPTEKRNCAVFPLLKG